MPNSAQIATYNFIRSEIARLRGTDSYVPLKVERVTALVDEGDRAAFRVNGARVYVKKSGSVSDDGLPDCPSYASGLLSGGRFLPAIAADLLSAGNPHKPFLHIRSHTPESFVAYLQHGTKLTGNTQNPHRQNCQSGSTARSCGLPHAIAKPTFARTSTSLVPSKEEFLAAIAAYDGDNHLYFEGLRKLQADWGNPTKMADAIWPWLRSWHAPFYRWGEGDPNAIASCIRDHLQQLNAFRDRTIDTLSASDESAIQKLFWAFSRATTRRNSKGFQSSTVGAAKVLHILAPAFLPLWDTEISDHYGCFQDAAGYIRFGRTMKQFVAAAHAYLDRPDDRSILKRIDEFNYSSITASSRS
jgi:hypothetical protein